MCSHVPNKGEQVVRYYGHYSNVSRGRRQKEDKDELIPYAIEPKENSKEYRKNWARLIQKIYEVDPLTCQKCSGKMKVISVIDDEEGIKKTLKHLGLWELNPTYFWWVKARPPPKANRLQLNVSIDYSRRGVGPYGPEADSHVPPCKDYLYRELDYSIEANTS